MYHISRTEIHLYADRPLQKDILLLKKRDALNSDPMAYGVC